MFPYIKYCIKLCQMRKAVCAITLFAFILNTLGADLVLASAGPRPTPDIYANFDPDRFNIPSYLGYIKDSWSAPRTTHGQRPTTIIHIQDTHCDYKAQNSIYELIGHISKTYGADLINMEGGEGWYDLSQFGVIPGPILRKKTADYFLKEGIISAPEFYAVNNPAKAKLWGLEDTALYRANLEVYRRSLESKQETESALKVLSYNLSLIKTRAYTKPLVELDLKTNSFREGKIDLKEYSAYLIQCASANMVDMGPMPNIAVLMETVGLESGIDFKRSTAERDELIERLTRYLPKARVKELSEKTIEFRAEKLTPSEYCLYIFDSARSADISLADYGDLTRYYAYVATYDKIKKEDLFKELLALESSIKEKLFSDPAQRDLDRITKDIAVIKGIFNITITPDDFRAYKERRADFDIGYIEALISGMARRYSITVTKMPDAHKLESHLRDMERFYELSYKRDEAFVRNMRYPLDANRVAIVVTGGFHTENLARLFRDNGISYVSIMPNFRLDDNPCPYFKRLAGERPALFDSVRPSPSAIALYTYFCDKAREIYGSDVAGMTDSWIRTTSRLLSTGDAVAEGGLRFVVSRTAPAAENGQTVREVPGVSMNGGKVYAVWDTASEVLRPGSINVMDGEVSPLLSRGDHRLISCDISNCVAVAFFNKRTGARFAAHVNPHAGHGYYFIEPGYGSNNHTITERYLDSLLGGKVTGDRRDWSVVISNGPTAEDDARAPYSITPLHIRSYINVKLGIPGYGILQDDQTGPDDAAGPSDVRLKHLVLKPDGLTSVNYSTDAGFVHGRDFDLSGGLGGLIINGPRISSLHRFITVCIVVAYAALGVMFNSHAANPAGVSLTNIAAAAQIYNDAAGKAVDGLLQDPHMSKIFKDYKATDKPEKVYAMADLAVEYFSKLPSGAIKEFRQYAKLAGLSEKAWVIFAALELTETSGADIVDPGNVRKLVAPDGGTGPMQLMKGQCLAINGYMDDINNKSKLGEYIGIVDRNKIAILEKFGFTHDKHIDLDKIDPLNRSYTCSVAAAIIALDHYAFSERYFVIDKETGSYVFKRQNEGPSDPGFDRLLSLIASYNIGFDDVRDILKSMGPWYGLSHIEWYKAFLSGFETKVTQSHNVRFKTFITMVLYMFPDNIELKAALQSLGYDVDFLAIKEAPAEPSAAPEAESEIGPDIQSPVGTKTSSMVIAPAEAVGPADDAPGSIFMRWPFWAALGTVVSIWAAGSALLIRFIRSAGRVVTYTPIPEGPAIIIGEQRLNFMEGSIYERKFIAQEKGDSRYTVVFDMDETLLWGDPKLGRFYMRPDADTVIMALKKRGIKVVLWTSGTESWAKRALGHNEDLKRLGSKFDLIITRDNYASLSNWQYIRHRMSNRLTGLPVTFKNIGVLDYDVMVDNDPTAEYMVKRSNLDFDVITVPPFDFDDLVRSGNIDSDEARLRASSDNKMMTAVVPALWPMLPPVSVAQMGKTAEVVSIDTSAPKAMVRNSAGEVVELKLFPVDDPEDALISAFSGLKGMAARGDLNEALLDILSFLKASPPGSVYIYDELIDDLSGFASAHFDCIAIHEALAANRIGIFHEAVEYLIKARLIRLYPPQEGILTVAVGDNLYKVKLSGEALAIAGKDPLNQHYLLRAFQREVFGDADRQLTRYIKDLQNGISPAEVPDERPFLTADNSVLMSDDEVSLRTMEERYRLMIREILDDFTAQFVSGAAAEEEGIRLFVARIAPQLPDGLSAEMLAKDLNDLALKLKSGESAPDIADKAFNGALVNLLKRATEQKFKVYSKEHEAIVAVCSVCGRCIGFKGTKGASKSAGLSHGYCVDCLEGEYANYGLTPPADHYLKTAAEYKKRSIISHAVSSERPLPAPDKRPNLITPDHISDTAMDIAGAFSDSYLMVKPCTIGMVIKAEPGHNADMILAERLAREWESIGRRADLDGQIERGVVQYRIGGVTYIAYVDDGTDTRENRDRLSAFADRIDKAGNDKERTFVWVLSEGSRLNAVPQEMEALRAQAHIIGLEGEYLPVSWQMLAGPLFANLIDSRDRKPEDISRDRIDAIVNAIISSISRMTGTELSEWDALRQELLTLGKDELAKKFNGTFFIKLPPIMPVTDAIEKCRKADLQVQTAL